MRSDESSELYKKTKAAPANLTDELRDNITQIAVTAFRALKMRDYARIDMRISRDKRIYVIEANPNPWLDPLAEFAMAAKEGGRTYPQLIGAIVDSAVRRY